MTDPAAAPAESPGVDRPVVAPERPVRLWDRVLTGVLLVILLPFALTVSVAGRFIGMASGRCAAAACNDGVIEAGFWIGVLGPWAVLIAATVIAVSLLVRRRLAFWVPLVAAVLMIASLLVGAAVAVSGGAR